MACCWAIRRRRSCAPTWSRGRAAWAATQACGQGRGLASGISCMRPRMNQGAANQTLEAIAPPARTPACISSQEKFLHLRGDLHGQSGSERIIPGQRFVPGFLRAVRRLPGGAIVYSGSISLAILAKGRNPSAGAVPPLVGFKVIGDGNSPEAPTFHHSPYRPSSARECLGMPRARKREWRRRPRA